MVKETNTEIKMTFKKPSTSKIKIQKNFHLTMYKQKSQYKIRLNSIVSQPIEVVVQIGPRPKPKLWTKAER